MQYNYLGKSGLQLSEISLGSWLTFGKKLDEERTRHCMHYAFDQGVNFFDNAEVYGNGVAEVVMGKGLKGLAREEIVVSTKIFWGGEKPNTFGLSRKHIIEGATNSLKRLQLDYVDLLYCHRPDPHTPIEEIVRAMDFLIKNGRVLYWGTSEWPAELINSAYQVAKEINCIAPTMEQAEYNLFHRNRIEVEYSPLYQQYGLGTTIWGPLACGLLSGKYNNGIPSDSRLAIEPQWRSQDMEARITKVKKLIPVAQDLNCTLAQLALAWCLTKSQVNTVILGVSSEKQLYENLQSIRVKKQLTKEVTTLVEALTE